MTTLLVLTTGQTDVQLVLDGVRHELNRDRCAALHEELERRTYALVDTPIQKGKLVESLPDGELHLCTPKLDAVLVRGLPETALVLETRRDARAESRDPRFAGAILEGRLKARGVPTIRRSAYLQGSERLENRDEPRDAVVRREVVRRLEQAVREALDSTSPSSVVLAATGGPPAVASLVEEIVRLHATGSIESLEIADGANANPPTADRAVSRTSVPEPLASFQARRRALDLIEKGNLLGAWAVVEPLHADEVERRWTRVVQWLARYASSLPIPPDCDIPLLGHPRMAVRGALRVELALRAGDVPRAVHGTVAFFEAALWDHLLEHFEPDPQNTRFLKLRSGAQAPASHLLRNRGNNDKARPFEAKSRSDGHLWFWFDEAGADLFTRDYIQKPQLHLLIAPIKQVKRLRNDVAHNEPTPALMDSARRQMRAAALWSSNDTFLSQPLVQAVLVELGQPNPGELLTRLLADVRERLLNPRSPSR